MRKLLPLTLTIGLALSGAALAESKLRWTVNLPERLPAWGHVRDMQKDSSYVATAAGGLVFTGLETNGALVALDAKTGEERWRYYTNGAIRTRASADKDKVIFGSDDGYLYCLGHDGKLKWRSPVGQGDRFVIGHGRLTSAWPVPTHPLLADGKVFVLGGCWPADGVFMNAFDADSGKLLWRSPSVHMRAMLIPHWIEDGKVHVRTYSGTGGKALRFDTETGVAEAWPKGTETQQPERIEFPGKGALSGAVKVGDLILGGDAAALHCAAPGADRTVNTTRAVAAPRRDTGAAKSILAAAGQDEGYALIVGLKDGALVEELLRNSELHVVAVDADPAKVDRIRRDLDSRGCFDKHRLAVLTLDLKPDVLPPYFASLVLSETGAKPGAVALESLRPYGGAALALAGGKWKAEVRGELEGAGDWDHEYANAAMNNSSGDKVVKAPLGILWYGGPASEREYYLHGNRPTGALISKGRMFLQGDGVMAGVDAYTGRLLWEVEIPEMYIFDGTHGGGGGGLGMKNTPWKNEKANAKGVPPIKRARATGFNWAVAPDCLYVFAAERCLRFDPATGEELPAWEMPLPKVEGETLCWGCPRIMGDVLVSTAFRPQDMYDAHVGGGGNGGDWSGDRMPMSHMLAVERKSGKLLWSQKANLAFGNRGFVATNNRAISIDLLQTDATLNFLEEGRKIPKADPSVRAFDLKTGKEVWTMKADRLLKYLSYIPDEDILLVANRYGRHWSPEKGWYYPGLTAEQSKRKMDRPHGVFRGLRGSTGEQLWEISERHYDGPFSVIGDLILNRYGTAFEPTSGKLAERTSPLTGQKESFGFKKSGCAVLGGCENLVGWRTAYHDMRNGTTVKLPGFEAGCTTSLQPASGMLNMPNFGIFHLRARAAAVSLAHRPSAKPWREFQVTKATKETPIERIGYNFGAPGDRYDENGTLWVRAVRGMRNMELRIEPKEEISTFVSGGDSHWIGGSGVEGAQSIRLLTALDQDKNSRQAATYNVRLFFAAPAGTKPGERSFDLSLEGQPLIEGLDPVAGGQPVLVKEFKGLEIKGLLDIEFTPKKGRTVLCGVELIQSNTSN